MGTHETHCTGLNQLNKELLLKTDYPSLDFPTVPVQLPIPEET